MSSEAKLNNKNDFANVAIGNEIKSIQNHATSFF